MYALIVIYYETGFITKIMTLCENPQFEFNDISSVQWLIVNSCNRK